MAEQILWVDKGCSKRTVVTSDHELTIRISNSYKHTMEKRMLLIYFDKDFIRANFGGSEYVKIGFSTDHKYFYFKPATKGTGHKLSHNSDKSLVCKISLANGNEEAIAESFVGTLIFEEVSKNLWRASNNIEWRQR